MRKDIEIPIANEIYVATIKEWDTDFLSQNWYVYLINNREAIIETVLVMSRGNNGEQKTSTLRHGLGNLEPKSFSKIEFLPTEVLGFVNEYWVTFFSEGKLFERRSVFEADSISENAVVEIPVMKVEGVLAK